MAQHRKYEFTGETKEHFGRTLRRIRSLVAIASLAIQPGDLGGWIESESNLAHEGQAWVFPDAIVCGKAIIKGGTFKGGTFWGGTFKGGTFWGGTFKGGTFWGGTFWGGTFWGGTFWGGTFKGGTFWGGTFEGGTSVTLQPLFIAGLTWPVTITDSHMTIGCQTHTLSAWWEFDDRSIAAMDSRSALRFWRAHKDMLWNLCLATGRVGEELVSCR